MSRQEDTVRSRAGDAETRLKLARCAMDLVVERGLNRLTVDAICERAQIRRDVFETHFADSDAVLLHVVALWRLERQAEALERPMRGYRAIRRLFDRALDCRRWPGVMRHLSAFLALGEEPISGLAVEPEERQAFFPGRPEVLDLSLPTLAEMIERHLSEAKEDGELPPGKQVRRMTYLLLAVFFGAPISAHTQRVEDLPEFTRLLLDGILSE